MRGIRDAPEAAADVTAATLGGCITPSDRACAAAPPGPRCGGSLPPGGGSAAGKSRSRVQGPALQRRALGSAMRARRRPAPRGSLGRSPHLPTSGRKSLTSSVSSWRAMSSRKALSGGGGNGGACARAGAARRGRGADARSGRRFAALRRRQRPSAAPGSTSAAIIHTWTAGGKPTSSPSSTTTSSLQLAAKW